MTVPTDNLPRHKDDFDRVYNLEDPSPYFTSFVEGPRTRRARPRKRCGHGPRAVDGSLQPCRATAGKRLKPPVSRIDRRLRARL